MGGGFSPLTSPQINCLQSPRGLNILRTLAIPYEKIPYHIHCSSSRRWLDDVMRQQKGIDDDQHVEHRKRGHHQEVDDQEGTGHEEVDHDD